MPMAIIFAEMAAAEVAAAAAAEAAAVTAAEVAAAEAAQIAAAEAASTAAAQAATQAATQAAAQQATQAGIMEVGGATANAPITAEAVQSAAMNSGLPPGFEQQLQNVQNLSQVPSVQVASANPTAGLESLQNQPVFQNVGGEGVTTPQTFPVNDGGITSVPQAAPQAPPPAPNTLPMGIDMPGTYMPPSNALYTPPASTYTAPPSAL